MGRAKHVTFAAAAGYTQRRSGTSKARAGDLTQCQLTIQHVMFPRNGQWGEDGFAICKVVHEGTGETMTAKGKFGPVVVGERMDVQRGEFKDDQRYGEFLQVWQRSYSDPVSKEALQGYLENLPGVGPGIAAAIVDTLGTDALAKIDANPQLLLTVKAANGSGLKAENMEAIIAKWEDLRADRKNLLYLSTIGLGDATARKVSAHFGTEAVKTIKADPYAMTKVDGVGFKIADHVAQKLGIHSTDPRRLAAGMEYLLERAESDGHVCLTEAEMLARAPKLLDRGFQKPGEPALRDAINAMVADGRLWRDTGADNVERIYTTELYVVETRLYQHLSEMLHEDEDHPAPSIAKYEYVVPKESVLTDEQWAAVVHARHDKLSILSGGPGTGKCVRGDTYIVADGALRQIRHLWGAQDDATFDGEGYWHEFKTPVTVDSVNDRRELVPGRAVRIYRQRVNETGVEVRLGDASRIVMTKRHRLLGLNGWTNEFSPGDLIAVPRTTAATGESGIHQSVTTLIAWQIAEGHEDAKMAAITQKDTEVLAELQSHAAAVGEHLGIAMNGCRVVTPANGGSPKLNIASMEWRDWLEANGYRWGSRSARKRIPDFIVGADNDTARTFIRNYFAAEGSVSESHSVATVTSASEEVIRQLQLMLRRFGIWLRVRRVRKAATNGANIARLYWTGTISGESLRVFRDVIGICDGKKQSRLDTVAIRATNPNIDLVPLGDLVTAATNLTGLPVTAFGPVSLMPRTMRRYAQGVRAAHPEKAREVLAAFDRVLDGSYECSVRERAALPGKSGRAFTALHCRALDSLDYDTLATIRDELARRVSSDIIWVRIKHVRDVHLDEWVYDLEVDEHHNYVAGGIITHNTTALRELIENCEARGETVACMAPTGKAAKRMQESTGRDATTIHRRLGWEGRNAPKTLNPMGGYDEETVFTEDVVVIDESSMLDMRLAERVFSHLSDHTRVVLVGDPDQLPAVGAGSVLLDLIESGRVPRTHLTQVHRQGKGSLLVENAHRIRQGHAPYWTKEEAEQATGQQYLDDFEFVECTDPGKAVAVTLDKAERVATDLGVHPNDLMVTAPSRKGTAGVWMLARAIQAKRNPHGYQFRDGDQPLRVGDRVMNTQNRYGKRNKDTGETDPDIMNGDVGKVIDYNPKTRVATVEFDDGVLTYGSGEMDALISSFASTTHKLQGSEAPAIICPYVQDSRMLNRNLIYTALTRARSKGVLIGSKDVIAAAVARDGSRRQTTLDLRVGSIPKVLKRRHDTLMQTGKGLKSVQQLLGGFALGRVGHKDLTPAGKAQQAAGA